MAKIYVKNMVCPRCIKVVREELIKIGLTPVNVILGEVDLLEKEEDIDLKKVKAVLEKEGFELLEDSKSKIIEAIKTEVIQIVQDFNEKNLSEFVFSKHLSKKLGKDYSSLSALFSKVEGITIEQFIILTKIEKVKELLQYGELTLSEISYKLGYSSVQHLSRQFKNITGMTATRFMKEFGQQK